MNAKLQFTPWAWAKLMTLRDAGDTEIAAYGISEVDSILTVRDLFVPKQTCTAATFELDDDSVAEMYEDLVEQGYTLDQFSRILIHTHPGSSAIPSSTDNRVFAEKFGKTGWAVMCIVSQTGEVYAELYISKPVPNSIKIPVSIDWTSDFDASDIAAWEAEYKEKVTERRVAITNWGNFGGKMSSPTYNRRLVPDKRKQMDEMEEWEDYIKGVDCRRDDRRIVLDEDEEAEIQKLIDDGYDIDWDSVAREKDERDAFFHSDNWRS